MKIFSLDYIIQKIVREGLKYWHLRSGVTTLSKADEANEQLAAERLMEEVEGHSEFNPDEIFTIVLKSNGKSTDASSFGPFKFSKSGTIGTGKSEFSGLGAIDSILSGKDELHSREISMLKNEFLRMIEDKEKERAYNDKLTRLNEREASLKAKEAEIQTSMYKLAGVGEILIEKIGMPYIESLMGMQGAIGAAPSEPEPTVARSEEEQRCINLAEAIFAQAKDLETIKRIESIVYRELSAKS